MSVRITIELQGASPEARLFSGLEQFVRTAVTAHEVGPMSPETVAMVTRWVHEHFAAQVPKESSNG